MNNTEFDLLTKEDLYDFYQDSLKDIRYLENIIQELKSELYELEGDYDAGYSDGRAEAEQQKYEEGYDNGYTDGLHEGELK